MTSADWSTKGRISSPAPNLSPTSFMAGSSTSLSVGTAPMSSTEASIWASTPSRLRRRMCQCSASCGRHVRGRVGDLGLLLAGLGLEVLDEVLERVVGAVEHEVVGELALLVAGSRRTA